MSRCGLCDDSLKIVQERPRPVRVALVSGKPGRQEAFIGRPYVGDTGKELNGLYLYLAGLRREDVVVNNCLRCWIIQGSTAPTDAQIDQCASHHLPSWVEHCDPEVLVLLGASACSLLKHATVRGGPCPSVELDKDHGRPITVDGKVATVSCERYFGDWSGVVWTFFDPASALHDSASMTPVMEDFKTLGEWLKGRWTPPHLDYKPTYAELESPVDFYDAIDDIKCGWGPSSRCAYSSPPPWVPTDTENDEHKPWSLQFAASPTRGYLIRSTNTRLLRLYREYLMEAVQQGGGLLCHNSPHDLEVGAKLGVWEWGRWPRFRDTMQEAYHQGNLPQGLKALGWRLLGVRMTDYSDVVMPPSRRKAVSWMKGAYLHAQETMRVQVWETFKKAQAVCAVCSKRVGLTMSKRCAKHKDNIGNPCPGSAQPPGEVLGLRVEGWEVSAVEKDLKRILGHSDKVEYDVWEKLGEARSDLLLESTGLVRELGTLPMPSIAHVPFDVALDYACQDATICGLVGEELERRAVALVSPQVVGMREVRGEWEIMEEDLAI